LQCKEEGTTSCSECKRWRLPYSSHRTGWRR